MTKKGQKVQILNFLENSQIIPQNEALDVRFSKNSSEARGLRNLNQPITSSEAKSLRDLGQPISSSEKRG